MEGVKIYFHTFTYDYWDAEKIGTVIADYASMYGHQYLTVLTGEGGIVALSNGADVDANYSFKTLKYGNTIFNVVHDPLLDNMMLNGHPRTPHGHQPLTSYQMTVFGAGIPLAIFKVKPPQDDEE